MTSYLISIIVKYALREGLREIGDPEALKRKAEQWLRDEIGGWGERYKEQIAISALHAAWGIIFSEIGKYLSEMGVELLAEEDQKSHNARSECTFRVCEKLEMVG